MKNKDKFYEIDKIFREMPNLWKISRYKENMGGILLCNKLKILHYYITIKENDEFYDFTIDVGKEYYSEEDLFWKQEFSKIKNTNGDFLEDFLIKHKIPYDKFKKLKSFLKENNYNGIWMNKDNTIFSLKPRSGLVYTTSESSNPPLYGDLSSIKKIDDKWYYFTDSNFP
ncbi:MAG: hypothetical protein JST55_07480 [Bacteroidetes bacterium]|nr:hypothetical protein [Bacteroidota bacterium]